MSTLRKVIWLIIPLIFLQGCSEFFEDDPDQKYFFEIEYTNHAWWFNHSGAYIDRKGDIYSYSITDPNKLLSGKQFTGAELDALYMENKTYIASLDNSQFDSMKKLIFSASNGEMSEGISVCADYGAVVYTAYLYDSDQDTYQAVTLRQAGDLSFRNLNIDAQTLDQWLVQLSFDYQLVYPGDCGFEDLNE